MITLADYELLLVHCKSKCDVNCAHYSNQLLRQSIGLNRNWICHFLETWYLTHMGIRQKYSLYDIGSQSGVQGPSGFLEGCLLEVWCAGQAVRVL